MDGETKKENLSGLEDLIILLASDSKSSRKMARDMFDELREDHAIGSRVVRLNSRRMTFDNQEQNFYIEDPSGKYSKDSDGKLTDKYIKYMIANGNTFFISKLENPELQRPYKFVIDIMMNDFCKEYARMRNNNRFETDERRESFKTDVKSYIFSKLPELLKGLMEDKYLSENLPDISRDISNIMIDYFDNRIIKAYNRDTKPLEREELLIPVKRFVAGYFAYDELITPVSKLSFLDELGCITKEICTKMINGNPKGKLNWILPFTDGRADKTNNKTFEFVRVDDLPDLAGQYGVNSVQMIRAHSYKLLDSFKRNNINYTNFTLTNEYISLLFQKYNSFEDLYIISPDKGGMADAMAFARELYIRTDGQFKGRVVVFDKTRKRAGQIEDMVFHSSFMYDPLKENKDINFIVDGKRQPYDKFYAADFKNPNSNKYIGHLFNTEFGPHEEDKLINIIKNYKAIFRDDIIATSGTFETAARRANEVYKSKIIGLVEHPSYTKKAIQKLDKLYLDGIIEKIYVSTSIVHPNASSRPWEERRSIVNRFATKVKDIYFNCLETINPELYNRLYRLIIR